jgi:hypothetical protein
VAAIRSSPAMVAASKNLPQQISYFHAKHIQYGIALPPQRQIIAGNASRSTPEFGQGKPHSFVYEFIALAHHHRLAPLPGNLHLK